MRQIAVSPITQASALSQARRALSGTSSHSGQALCEPGDYVDYHRPTSDKDKSGWKAPVKVVKNAPEQGGVICRINNQDRPCRYQDVRHTLHLAFVTYIVNLFAKASNGVPRQLQIVLGSAESMVANSQCTIGTVYDYQTRQWRTTSASRQQTRLIAAVHYVMSNILFLTDVMAVRFAKGVRRLASLQEATMSVLYA